MNEDIKRLRHGKERFYGPVMSIAGLLIWAGLFCVAYLVLVGVINLKGLTQFAIFGAYLLAYIAFLLLKRLFTRAYILGHYVLVAPDQFPRLHDMVQRGAAEIGLRKAPETFVYNSSGVMNAMAVRAMGRRYVWLTSALLDADTEAQIRFVVGHELGHHAFGHLNRWRNLLRFPARLVPFLGAAYSRSRELSCDRLGAYLARDLPASLSALQMLASGSARLNAEMNTAAFMRQEDLVPSMTGFILHAFSGYPRLTKRAVVVQNYFATAPAADLAPV